MTEDKNISISSDRHPSHATSRNQKIVNHHIHENGMYEKNTAYKESISKLNQNEDVNKNNSQHLMNNGIPTTTFVNTNVAPHLDPLGAIAFKDPSLNKDKGMKTTASGLIAGNVGIIKRKSAKRSLRKTRVTSVIDKMEEQSNGINSDGVNSKHAEYENGTTIREDGVVENTIQANQLLVLPERIDERIDSHAKILEDHANNISLMKSTNGDSVNSALLNKQDTEIENRNSDKQDQSDTLGSDNRNLDIQSLASSEQNSNSVSNHNNPQSSSVLINPRKRKFALISKGLEVGGTSKRNKPTDQNQEKKKTLLEEYFESQRASGKVQKKVDDVEKQLEMEEKLLEIVSKKMPLTALNQRREGVSLSGMVSMGWKPPPYIESMTNEQIQEVRKRNRIDVQGENIPNPIQDFESLRIPKCILHALKKKGILFPSPVQCQALPVLMSGRDLLGVAYTGSGKTLAFSLPMILHALLEEYKMPIRGGEGPIGLILCPSRELAKQTGDVVENICEALHKDGHPLLRTMYCVGGHSLKEYEESLAQGVHMIIATPGRLKHMLNTKKFNLDICKYFCLDEADRLIDRGFEQEIREIFDYLTSEERQTVLFSATMPAKIRLFAESALTNHIIVNVGRAGSANTNIVQEVEYVKSSDRIRQLIESLKKSPPPALIFAHNKDDVDEIHEYLLLKGVRASSIHGGKTQAEREEAVQDFISGRKNVLVATDIASKGLDFKNIQHVINFDLPPDIEDYVHRIGRTGRGGSTGLATSYINEETPVHFLLDLRGLLIEAKQELPKMLQDLGEHVGIQTEIGGTKGCFYCGGLGHRITQCQKLARDRKEMMNQQMSEE